MKTHFFGLTLVALFLLTSCQSSESDVDEKGHQQTMDSLVTAYVDAWESGDSTAFDEILAFGFTRSVNEEGSYGIDSLKRIATDEGGLTNVSIEVRETIYGDNRAAVSWTMRAALNGESVTVPGVSFVTFEDGMIASERAVMDSAPIMQAMMRAEGGEGGAPSDTTSM